MLVKLISVWVMGRLSRSFSRWYANGLLKYRLLRVVNYWTSRKRCYHSPDWNASSQINAYYAHMYHFKRSTGFVPFLRGCYVWKLQHPFTGGRSCSFPLRLWIMSRASSTTPWRHNPSRWCKKIQHSYLVGRYSPLANTLESFPLEGLRKLRDHVFWIVTLRGRNVT